MGTLAARIRSLIDTRHQGNVRAAARDTGVPHPTLVRIVNSTTTTPHTDTLQALARFYRVSIDWLITGAGAGPKEVEWYQGLAETLRWDDLVIGLSLHTTHPQLHRDLLDLPNATATAAHLFDVAALGGHPTRRLKIGKHDVEQTIGVAPGFLAASRREHEAWLAFMDEWIARAGEEQVRQTLIRHASDVRKRFLKPRK